MNDVLKAKKGSNEAFSRLIRDMESSLYHAARSILKSDFDCADAIQETILKGYSSIHTLREPQYFKTWLIRILLNECKKISKKNQKVVPLTINNEPSGL